MSSWTPAQWNSFFIYAGGFVVLVIGQVSGVILLIRNGRKTDANSEKLAENTVMTKATKDSTDGIVDKLVGVASSAAYTAGKNDQVAKQADIQTAVDAAKKAAP
jgi:hypothetical protein